MAERMMAEQVRAAQEQFAETGCEQHESCHPLAIPTPRSTTVLGAQEISTAVNPDGKYFLEITYADNIPGGRNRARRSCMLLPAQLERPELFEEACVDKLSDLMEGGPPERLDSLCPCSCARVTI